MIGDPPNTSYEFLCPDCGHIADVCGREGACGVGSTVTIVFKCCRELYDVLTSRGMLALDIDPRCPNDNKHAVAKWTFPGPCPKCGAEMKPGRYKTLLD